MKHTVNLSVKSAKVEKQGNAKKIFSLQWTACTCSIIRNFDESFEINPLMHGRFSDPYFKVLCRDFFFHKGIRKKSTKKVKNFKVWVA